jgi:ABC-type phosphate transport system substrate-binding protein
MHRIKKIGIASAGACALVLGLTSPAFADYAPSSTDVVGVGSDTVQNIADFIADGDNVSDPGYNSVGAANKMVSFDATPDANDRAGYLNGSTNASLKALTPTITLRAGTSPVQRPNGSGAGINAILADTGSPEKISFVRMSRPPKAAEESTAVSALHTQLHTVQISTDPLEIAYDQAASNIPAAGLSVAELTSIYSCSVTKWNQLPGNSAGSGNTIIPLVPQTGSGTRSTFLADISVTTPGSCVQTVEENDPTAITLNAAPADAIDPFSAGRLALYNTGYFHDPTAVFPGGASLTPGILLQQGFTTPGGSTHRVAGDGANVYDDVRGLYIVFRESDNTSTTPWQPGSTLNWVKTLFVGSSAYVSQSFNAALISAAGATPAYVDEGAGFTVG